MLAHMQAMMSAMASAPATAAPMTPQAMMAALATAPPTATPITPMTPDPSDWTHVETPQLNATPATPPMEINPGQLDMLRQMLTPEQREALDRLA